MNWHNKYLAKKSSIRGKKELNKCNAYIVHMHFQSKPHSLSGAMNLCLGENNLDQGKGPIKDETAL